MTLLILRATYWVINFAIIGGVRVGDIYVNHNRYDRSTFYGGDARGYTDYSAYGQAQSAA